MKQKKYETPFKNAIYRYFFMKNEWVRARKITRDFNASETAKAVYRILKRGCSEGVFEKKMVRVDEPHINNRRIGFYRVNPKLINDTEWLKIHKVIDENGEYIPIEESK